MASSPFTQCLPSAELARYSRPIILRGWGPEKQVAVRGKRVLVVGAGGLGCPAVMYLAGAGVGSITIVDDDVVASDNLHRQVAHTEAGAAERKPKAQSLAEAAMALNPTVRAHAVCERFGAANGVALAADADVVVDATDNPVARYLVNDAAVLAGHKPLVWGAALGWDGQVTVHGYRGGPCYRCVHPAPPPANMVGSCSDAGVMGPVPGLVGCYMALEALKVLAGDEHVELSGKLLHVDMLDHRNKKLQLRPAREDCAVCGKHPSITQLEETAASCRAAGHVDGESENVIQANTAMYESKAGHVPRVSPQEAMEVAGILPGSAATALLLDVRSNEQHGAVHLNAAVHVPIGALQWRTAEAVATVQRAMADAGMAKVLVLCRRGLSSLEGAAILQKAGIDAASVNGGMERLHREFPEWRMGKL